MPFVPITDNLRTIYKQNLKEALALRPMKISATFSQEEWDGGHDVHVVDIYKSTGARKNASEGSPTNEMNFQVEPIALLKDTWDDGFKVKKADKMSLLIEDMTSRYYNQMMININRGIQYDTCVGAFFDYRYVKGTTGATIPVPYDNTQNNKVIVNLSGSNEGLTLQKLGRAIRLMVDNDVNIEDYDIHLPITPDEAESLFNEEKLQNREYVVFDMNGEMKQTLKGLQVPNFRGVKFHLFNDRYNKLAVPGQSNQRRLPMYTSEHMHYVEYGDIIGDLGNDPAHKFIPIGHAEQIVGAGRSQDKAVIEINVLKQT